MGKKFGCDITTLLHSNVALLFDCTCEKSMSVDEFVVGFHAKHHKISMLDMENELKVYLLLKQANLDSHERDIVIGFAGGSYSLQPLLTSLCNAYRGESLPPSSMASNLEKNHCLRPKQNFTITRVRELQAKHLRADAITKNHPFPTPMSVPDRMKTL